MTYRLMTMFPSSPYAPFARALDKIAESKDDFEHVWQFWQTINKHDLFLSTKHFMRFVKKINLRGLQHGSFRRQIYDDQEYAASSNSLMMSPRLHSVLELFCDQLLRRAEWYDPDLNCHEDYINYFHMLADILAEKMDEHGITHVVFSEIPHHAIDALIYELAQSKGIETIILYQYSPDRIFSMKNINDYGVCDLLEKSRDSNASDDFEPCPLFYMDEAWQTTGPRGQLDASMYFNILKFLARNEPLTLFRPTRLAEVIARTRSTVEVLPVWRTLFRTTFNYQLLGYYEQLAKLEKDASTYYSTLIEGGRPFVYVPLHLQPEMSTSTLGGVYRDQLLMIEHLDGLLPEGWEIAVKENPKQGTFNRESTFFHRLQRVKSVNFVPSDANTHLLMKHARLVATVTGTAGYEAIQMGTPVVAFGSIWYNCLPGVTRFHQDIDLEQVADNPVDIEGVSRLSSLLVNRQHPGTVVKDFWNAAENFNKSESAKQIASLIYDLTTGQVPFSFGNSA